MQFLDLEKFADFVTSRGFHLFNRDTLKILWKLGVLRADFVHSRRKLKLKGINYIGKSQEGWYVYSDCRKITKRNRLVDIPRSRMVTPQWIKLYFHPFRYYLVTHLARILDFRLHPLQLVLSSKGSHEVVDLFINRRKNILRRNPLIYDRLEYWHGLAELAIATEPCVYGKIFDSISHGREISFSKYSSIVNDYWRNVRPCYENMRKDVIDEYREDVCIEAERLSENKDVNILLRMMNGESRLNLKGEIGGAVYLHSMAEVLRRGYERATGKTLKEEDELGFGWLSPGVKEMLYGAGRVLDDRRARHFFLQQHGLSYGTRVHWYVEGETEAGALSRVFRGSSAISIVNLRGRVAEKNVAAFIENLKQDTRSGIFSMVSIDGDRSDNIRVVQGAAKGDDICCMFFIAVPDFELHNFSKGELIEIFAGHADRSGSGPIDRGKILKLGRGCANANELISMFNDETGIHNRIKKGEPLGAMLCDYALKHRRKGGKGLRPFIEAIQIAVQSVRLNYNITRSRMRVDPDTGRLINRRGQ